MCGRFVIDYTWAEVHAAMSIVPASAVGRNDPPRYNVAPTQDVGFVHSDWESGETTVSDGRWWLVPFWAKEMPKYPLFNARSETAHEKSSFREAFKSKRCLIPASGYFEWTKADDGGKDPFFIHLTEKRPLMFAGLWAHNDNLGITSCTILTMPAAEQIKHLHDRMPATLSAEYHSAWIDPESTADEARAMLDDNHGSELIYYRVSRDVNSSTAKGPQLIEALRV